MPVVFPLILVFAALLVVAVLALGNTEQNPTRKFSLRGFLMFVALWAICLSPYSALALKAEEQFSWTRAWVIPFAWLVLAAFYLHTRHFAAMLIHSVGVLFVLPLFGIGFLTGSNGKESDFVLWLLMGLICGSFAGLLYFSIMRLLRLRRQNQP